ncbi:MAG TPA: hypothetical protein VG324_02540, partial [Blastocatellia bacterium]|nr:hypothetical protein [Blastocatellia bacterium]
MRRKKGFVGQCKLDGHWYARLSGDIDRTPFAPTREESEALLVTMAQEAPEMTTRAGAGFA